MPLRYVAEIMSRPNSQRVASRHSSLTLKQRHSQAQRLADVAASPEFDEEIATLVVKNPTLGLLGADELNEMMSLLHEEVPAAAPASPPAGEVSVPPRHRLTRLASEVTGILARSFLAALKRGAAAKKAVRLQTTNQEYAYAKTPLLRADGGLTEQANQMALTRLERLARLRFVHVLHESVFAVMVRHEREFRARQAAAAIKGLSESEVQDELAKEYLQRL